MLLGVGFDPGLLCQAQPAANAPGRYEFRPQHDPDGIGKFFLGREIAQVMGHQGADWLERPEREAEEKPNLLVDQLNLRPGQVVADIGAGTGYFTRRLAGKVGPTGRVLAVDIQPEMLALLATNLAAAGIDNVRPILGTEQDPKLPAQAVDLVLLVDVYHEFAFPYEMMRHICRSLKPGGRVVFAEYRGEDPDVPIKPLHKMTEAQVKKEMAVQPLRWIRTIAALPRQHLIVFERRMEDDGAPPRTFSPDPATSPSPARPESGRAKDNAHTVPSERLPDSGPANARPAF